TNPTVCAANVTEKSIATGGRECTDGAPATGTGLRATCCAPTAIIHTSHISTRWRPSRRRSRRAVPQRAQSEGEIMPNDDPVTENVSSSSHPSRRLFNIAAASAAASWIMTACGPKRLYEAPKERLQSLIADQE